MTAALLIAAATALVLGVRHGMDWDHLAAIADLAGSPGSRRGRSFGLALWYCLGHGTVIILLGVLVGLLGVRLPGGLDRVFEVFVGGTLVVLGLVVLVQVARQRGEYRFVSRWRMVLGLAARIWARRRGADARPRPVDLSRRAAFGIGIIHGTGAETPTQLVLFGTAATAGSTAGAALVLGAFVTGLVASDLAVALVWVSGRLGATRVPFGQAVLGALTGIASVAVGVTFIAQKSALLPSLFGG